MVRINKNEAKQLAFKVKVSHTQQILIKLNRKLVHYKYTTFRILANNWLLILNIVLLITFSVFKLNLILSTKDYIYVIFKGFYGIGLLKASTLHCYDFKWLFLIWYIFNFIYILFTYIFSKKTYIIILNILLVILLILNLLWIKMLLIPTC